MPIYSENILIKNINLLIERGNIKQKDLESKLHFNQSDISKYLSGKRSLTLPFVYAIAQFFNVTIDSLLHEELMLEPHHEKNSETLSYQERCLASCDALANLFKYSNVSIDRVTRQERTFVEECDDEFPDGNGIFYEKHDEFNLVPTHEYITLFFSNYTPIETSFDSHDDYEEYRQILQDCGNFDSNNAALNSFLKKLTDLNNAYKAGSMDYESYVFSIDKNVEAFKREIQK